MKKKIVLSLLAAVMTIAIVASGTSRVLAEPDSEQTEEITEEEVMEEEVPETAPEAEATEEAEETEEESEDIEEVVTEEVVIEETTDPDIAEIQGMKISLQNKLGKNLVSIEIKNFYMDEYSENLLKEEQVISDEEAFFIGIPEEVQDQELGMYDVRISYADGSVVEIPFVPFLEDTTGVLYCEEGTVLIKIRDDRLEAEAEPVSEYEMMQLEAEASRQMADALVKETE